MKGFVTLILVIGVSLSILAQDSRLFKFQGVVYDESSEETLEGFLVDVYSGNDIFASPETGKKGKFEAELFGAENRLEPEPSVDDALAAADVSLGGDDIAEPAAEPEPAAVVEPETPEAAVKASRPRRKRTAGQSAKKPRTIPWYVALLVIIVFLIALAVSVFLILNLVGSSFDLPLDLLRDLFPPG